MAEGQFLLWRRKWVVVGIDRRVVVGHVGYMGVNNICSQADKEQ